MKRFLALAMLFVVAVIAMASTNILHASADIAQSVGMTIQDFGMLMIPVGLGYLTYLRAPLGNCKTLRFTNTTGADLAAGAWATVNDLYGIVLEATADTEEGVIIYETPSQGYEAAKDAVAVAEGEAAYLITASGLVTNVDGAGANPHIGHFAEAAASGTARVRTVLQQQAA